MTLQELKDKGYKVKVRHYRYPFVKLDNYINLPMGAVGLGELMPEKDIEGPKRFPRGGLTRVEVTSPENWNYAVEAHCSLKDGFDRKRGVRICLGRLGVSIENKVII